MAGFPPLSPLRSFHDPGIWPRVLREIRQVADQRAEHLLLGRWKTTEEAREIVGFLNAVNVIIGIAEDLTQPDEDVNTGA